MRHLFRMALMAALGCTPSLGRAETTVTTAPSPASMITPQDFGAIPDGQNDCTTAIQQALDAAATTGSTVLLPAGRYLVAGHLRLPAGVTLRGVHDSPRSFGPPAGSVILATGGHDNEAAPPLFHLGRATAVIGLTVWYPRQTPEQIVPYPWTFQLEDFDNAVENVTLINSYNAIRTGPAGNGRHRIRNIQGCALRRGILVDMCTDIGRIENCHFHCQFWSTPDTGGRWDSSYRHMADHLEAYTFARTDWQYLTNNFVFPARVGWLFIHGDKGPANGHMTGCGADACQTAVQIEALQPMGLLITGGQFVAFEGPEPVQVRIGEHCNASVRFVNCAFWGQSHHNAVLKGRGFTSFSDCYFSNWHKDAAEKPLIVAEAGRVQIQHSTFATAHPSILLGPGVAHALVRGNNGIAGVSIINQAGANSIISDNEPPPAPPPPPPPPPTPAPAPPPEPSPVPPADTAAATETPSAPASESPLPAPRPATAPQAEAAAGPALETPPATEPPGAVSEALTTVPSPAETPATRPATPPG